MDVSYGLLALQAKYSPVTFVESDPGTGLWKSVVNLRAKDGTLLFDNALFHALNTDRQQSNLIELYIRILKCLMRTGLNSNRNHKIPSLTYIQLFYVFICIDQEFNSIPDMDNDSFMDICPNDFLAPHNRLTHFPDVLGKD